MGTRARALGKHAVSAAASPSKWDAVARALREGIQVGGEHFRWLAPSSSQMKSMGMWFLRETDYDINAPKLRRRLGDFSEMKTAAIYLARLGQTLSGESCCRAAGLEPMNVSVCGSCSLLAASAPRSPPEMHGSHDGCVCVAVGGGDGA